MIWELPAPLLSKVGGPGKSGEPLVPVRVLATRIAPLIIPPPPPLLVSDPTPTTSISPLKLKLPFSVSAPVTISTPAPVPGPIVTGLEVTRFIRGAESVPRFRGGPLVVV